MTKRSKKRKKRTWRDAFGPNERHQRVRPTESFDYIPNPHRGTTTFQRFQGDALYPGDRSSDTDGPTVFKRAPKHLKPNRNYAPWTTVSYCRWPWSWLEPKKGKYNWRLVDGALKAGRDRGQTVQMRFQPYTLRVDYSETPIKARRHPPQRSVNVPDWYWDTGATWLTKGTYAPNEPDSNDPRYLEHFGDFIRAFAERYDGHHNLESIDIAYAGFWGESGGNTTKRTAEKLAEIYLKSFRKTQLLSMVGTAGCKYAARKTRNSRRHLGWRADCFGDLRFVKHSPDVPDGLNWTHMYEAYPREVVQCGVVDAWKTAPVTMETCGNAMTWHKRGYDLDWIVEQGYRYHMTFFMPKSVAYPKSMIEKLVAFDKRIGYRFVLKQVRLPLEATPGGRMEFQTFIENVGCAPIYRPYKLAYRFTQGRRSLVAHSKQDIRTWLPGNVWFAERITLPKGLKPGEATIDVGIVNDDDQPVVWFAIKGKLAAGWHPMTKIDVV